MTGVDPAGGFEVHLELERRIRSSPVFRLDVEFRTGAGITVVFGKSGAGKSTLLLSLLGALRPASGRIVVAGRSLFDDARGVDVEVRRRRLGIVFQDALLFPHLDAIANVAFALRGRGRLRAAGEMLERTGAASLARRFPADLSGGERQRVALARALAARPAALLLDEPFSALDAPARERLGTLLIGLQRSTGVPFLHVTHDLGEALRLGTALIVMDGGRVVQSGIPSEVVGHPASAAAARAVGTENLFRGTVRRHLPGEGYSEVDLGGVTVETGLLDAPPGSTVALALRAEDILLAPSAIRGTSARNVLQGTVQQVERRGASVETRIDTPLPFRVIVTTAAARELALAPGKSIFMLIKASAFHRVL